MHAYLITNIILYSINIVFALHDDNLSTGGKVISIISTGVLLVWALTLL